MSTEQTKKDIDNWTSEPMRQKRYEALAMLAEDAGLEYEFAYLPALHVKNMDYKDYGIWIQGLNKSKWLRRIAEK